jgi:hypothetical protein
MSDARLRRSFAVGSGANVKLQAALWQLATALWPLATRRAPAADAFGSSFFAVNHAAPAMGMHAPSPICVADPWVRISICITGLMRILFQADRQDAEPAKRAAWRRLRSA